MSVKKTLNELLATFPEDQLREVLDFARFLNARQEREEWRRFGSQQFARAYGPDEPEYTEAGLMPEMPMASDVRVSPSELRKISREQRQAILTAAAEMAEQDYRSDKGLTGFDAFSEEERE
jgi:hypothetical protein